MELRLRPVEDDALAAEEVAAAIDEEPSRGKDAGECQAVLAFGKDEDVPCFDGESFATQFDLTF